MTVRFENISFAFNSNKKILDNVSINLVPGKIYALMGANGAGKSTLFNLATGFLKLQSGIILLNNRNSTTLKPYQINKAGIARTFQDLRLIGNLTVKENVALAFQNNLSDKWYNGLLPSKKLKQQGEKLQQRAAEILTQFQLAELKSNLAKEISYGQQKLLNIACCVANDPEVLLLDEPVAGINPMYMEQLIQILMQLRQNGKTILLIEHNTEFISKVADCIYFLSNGKIKEYTNLEIMKMNSEVINAFM